VHYCDNETVQGVEFKGVPDVGEKLLVADFSSNFLSKTIDVSKYAVLYAGAQKNFGPAGVTVVIVREDLLGSARSYCPAMLDYKTMADNESMYNTPPCWAIYVCGLVFKKLLREGGLSAMQEKNETKVLAFHVNAALSALIPADGSRCMSCGTLLRSTHHCGACCACTGSSHHR
jgi:phosphoserine aminotransferase